MRLNQARVAPVAPGAMNPEQRVFYDAVNQRFGSVFNVFRTMLHYPKLLKKWNVFAAHVLWDNSLSARDRQLVILRTGWLSRAGYEWAQHTRIGRNHADMNDADFDRITEGAEANGWADHERWLLRAVDELHGDQHISDPVWEALAAHYSTEQLMDIVFACGEYTLVSMALNAFGVQLDDDLETHAALRPPEG